MAGQIDCMWEAQWSVAFQLLIFVALDPNLEKIDRRRRNFIVPYLLSQGTRKGRGTFWVQKSPGDDYSELSRQSVGGFP